jgi:hypothetical protein
VGPKRVLLQRERLDPRNLRLLGNMHFPTKSFVVFPGAAKAGSGFNITPDDQDTSCKRRLWHRPRAIAAGLRALAPSDPAMTPALETQVYR